MNKKFLTALLLGAFTIASTSTLVSCKDYDDDINGLQEQITSNDNDIAALQSKLQETKTALETEVANLKNDLATEKARAEKAEKDLGESLADANADILAEVARARAAEGELNKLISDELTRATAAEAALEAKIKLANEAIDAINAALETKASKEELKAAVADINAKLLALGDDLADAQAKLQKAIDDEADRAKKAEEEILGKVTEEASLRATALQAEKEARETAIAALELQDKTLAAFDEKINARVKAIEDDYLTSADKTELKGLIEAAKSDLVAQIATAKAQVLAELTTQVGALNNAITAQKTELEGKIETAKKELNKAIQDAAEASDAAIKAEAKERAEAVKDLEGQLLATQTTFQQQINTLNSRLTSEVTRLEGLITAAQTAANNAKTAADNAQIDATKAQTDLQKYIDSSAEALAKAQTSIQQSDLDEFKTQLLEEIAQQYASKDDVDKVKETADYATAVVEELVRLLGGTIEIITPEEAESGVKQAIYAAVIKKAPSIAGIKIHFPGLDQLRGLVAYPDLYYHGIQAFEASKYEYQRLTVDAAGLNDQASGSKDWYSDKVKTTAATWTHYIPDLTATYHLNPSKAYINTDPSVYKFVVLNEKYTREMGGAKVQPVIYKATKKNIEKVGNVVEVKARVGSAENIKNIAADEAVTVIALQYAMGDTVITSDYAALTSNTYKNLKLNNVAPQFTARQADNPHSTHLWLTAKEAVDEAFDAANTKVVKIAWDSKGVNLYDIVNTHRDFLSGSSSSIDVAWDTKASDGMLLNKYGLKYSFQLLGYKKGTNSTSESAHAWIYETEDGKLLFVPQKPDENGKARHAEQYDAAEIAKLQNRGAEIGREPLVRVLLTNTKNTEATNDDDIVAVGYIKFHIDDVADPVNPDVYKTYDFSFDDAYTLICNDDNVFTGKVEWNEVEHKILSDINLNATEFRNNYTLDGSTPVFVQYNGNNSSSLALSPQLGEVRENPDGIQEGMTTDVFQWTVGNTTAWNKLKKVGDKIEVWVRYHKNPTFTAPGSEASYSAAPGHIVLHFTWAPKAVNRDPKTAFNKNIISNYWYGAYDVNPGSGDNNIHGNVEAVKNLVTDPAKLHFGQTAEADDEFIFDIKSTLNGNKIAVNAISGYTALNNVKTVSIDFVAMQASDPHANIVTDVNGHTYTLIGRREGNKSWLVAKSTTGTKPEYRIAQMYWDVTNNPEAGAVKFGGKVPDEITPGELKVAQDLLNYAGRMEQGKGQTLTAKVEVKVNTCAPFGSVPVDNSTFFVKFLRPISATPAQGTDLRDAVTGGSLAAVKMEFVDWRNHKFTDTSVTNGEDYYAYYGVSDNVANLVLPTNGTGTDEDGNTYYKLNPSKIKTTLGNGGTLSGISSNLSLSWYPPTKIGTPATVTYRNKTLKDEGFGILVYDNNGANVSEFELTIPVDVKYDWGTIKTSFKATVHETTWGQVKRK